MNLSYEKNYIEFLSDILNNPDSNSKENRTASDTIMSFGKSFAVDLRKGFPILFGRKMFPKTFFTELKWFLEGETNIKRFQDAGIKIWDKWADKNGDLGPVYGHQLRNFNGVDQLKLLISNLKQDKNSRRHVITLWNPNQLNRMLLPPCYHTFTFSVVNGTLNCHVSMRSSDVFVGLPYDIALFASFMHLLCNTKGINLKPGKLLFSLTDAHIYLRNIESVHEYLNIANKVTQNYVYVDGPQLNFRTDDLDIFNFDPLKDLSIINYYPEKKIKVEVVE